jgi:hypothetical protein
MSVFENANRLPKAAARKSNIPKADARANPPEHVRFRIEVSVPEQRGPAFPYAAIKTSHDGASALAPGNVLRRKGCN